MLWRSKYVHVFALFDRSNFFVRNEMRYDFFGIKEMAQWQQLRHLHARISYQAAHYKGDVCNLMNNEMAISLCLALFLVYLYR